MHFKSRDSGNVEDLMNFVISKISNVVWLKDDGEELKAVVICRRLKNTWGDQLYNARFRRPFIGVESAGIVGVIPLGM